MARYRAGMCAVLAGHPDRGHALLRCCLDSADRAECAGELLRAAARRWCSVRWRRLGGPAPGPSRAPGTGVRCHSYRRRWSTSPTPSCERAGTRRPALMPARACAQRCGRGSATPRPTITPYSPWPRRSRGTPARSPGMPRPSLATARRHGLAQAATLAQMGGRTCRPRRPAVPSTRPTGSARWSGPAPGAGTSRCGCSPCPAMWRPPCSTGQPDEFSPGRSFVEEFARWAAFGAPIRRHPPNWPAATPCSPRPGRGRRALPQGALTLHDEAGGDSNGPVPSCCTGNGCAGDAGCARPATASGAALVGFDRCGARVWARGRPATELRAAGKPPDAPDRTGPDALSPPDTPATAHRPVRRRGRHRPGGGAAAGREHPHGRLPPAERLRRPRPALPGRTGPAGGPGRTGNGEQDREGNRPVHDPRDRPDGMSSFGGRLDSVCRPPRGKGRGPGRGSAAGAVPRRRNLGEDRHAPSRTATHSAPSGTGARSAAADRARAGP